MERLRLVVLGSMGLHPFGGQAWLYLNWLSGLRRLGHDVYYVEDHSTWFFDPVRNAYVSEADYAAGLISHVLSEVQLSDKWALRSTLETTEMRGMTEDELNDLYKNCDALLNIIGATQLDDDHPALNASYRIFVETDPVSNQLRLHNGDDKVRHNFDRHHAIFTYGENYGAPDCGVPVGDISYLKTRQPVDLALWPHTFTPESETFTTIGNYRQDDIAPWVQDLVYEGVTYQWSKHYEWEQFISMPSITGESFEMCTTIREATDEDKLVSAGWKLAPAIPRTLDVLGAYRRYIQGSRAEFTVAKDQNVRLRSGWFSERSVCYLASGKPVIAQDTAFSAVLPTGYGLFSFQSLEEAAAAVEEIKRDYPGNCTAAREIAQEYFETTRVVDAFLTDAGLT
ncbi:MAG: hypothetical protein ACRDLB_12630 [Actinomycetota bacterium]